MTLRQRNTFGSRDCLAPAKLRLGTVRPSRNHFSEPKEYLASGDDERGFKTVELASVFKRTRAEFQRLDATNGNSIENQEGFSANLVTRGLYSDYELIISPQELTKIDVSKVEDILIRFDLTLESPCN